MWPVTFVTYWHKNYLITSIAGILGIFEKLSKIPCSHFLPFFRPFLTRKFFWAKSIFFEREHLLLFLFWKEKDFVCSLLPLFCFDFTTHVAFFLDATLYLFKGPEVYLNLFCEFFFWENSLFCILNIWGFVSFFFLSFFSVFFFENSNRTIPTIFFSARNGDDQQGVVNRCLRRFWCFEPSSRAFWSFMSFPCIFRMARCNFDLRIKILWF